MYRDNPDYVAGRLRGTMVRYQGEPVIVGGCDRSIGGGLVLYYTDLQGVRSDWTPIAQFNLVSPPLGYANTDGTAWYIARQPKRHDWRQGLRRENLCVISSSGQRGYDFGDLKPVAAAIKGEYPQYQEVLERVEDIYQSCAFSKNFSIDDTHKLWYKGSKLVGDIRHGAPQLSKRFRYLEEVLQEDIGNV